MKKPVPLCVFLIWLCVFEAALVAGIVCVIMYAPALQVPVITVVCIFGISAIASASFRLLWNRMLTDFPQKDVPLHAKKKSFQSFSFGSVNMGLSINATVDESYLHIQPILLWRVLGAASASIPFSKMVPGEKPTIVHIGSLKMAGPRWCLENASGTKDPSP